MRLTFSIILKLLLVLQLPNIRLTVTQQDHKLVLETIYKQKKKVIIHILREQ